MEESDFVADEEDEEKEEDDGGGGGENRDPRPPMAAKRMAVLEAESSGETAAGEELVPGGCGGSSGEHVE